MSTIGFTSEPTGVRTAAEDAEYALGTLGIYQGREYRYVCNGAAAVHAKGAPAWAASATVLWTIGKIADVVGDVLQPLGACPAIPTLGFGWMFVRGGVLYGDELVLGDGSIAAQDDIYAAADVFTTATLGTHTVFGQALYADTPFVSGYFNFLC